jgi:chorismate-pyruvate lyase
VARAIPHALIVVFATSVCVFAQAPAAVWPDTYLSRLQLLALIQTLNSDILGSRSATRSLELWCRDHRLASDPRMVARLQKDITRPVTDEQRRQLEVGAAERVTHRRVQLSCGNRLLSEADNWYVPGRLTAGMNQRLETSDTPFGVVVEELQPYRVTFDVRMLWSPLPAGWAHDRAAREGSGEALAIPDALFEHGAILYTREHKPFAVVREVYQRQLIDFPPPPR